MKANIAYDLIVLVSNNLDHDRRLQRTCKTLKSRGWNILSIGRVYGEVDVNATYDWDIKRVVCKYNSGPLFYYNLLVQFKNSLSSIRYKRLLCMDEDTIGILNMIDTEEVEVYFDAHELFTEVPELKGKGMKKWIWSRWAKWAIRKVDYCYTVNNSIADILTDRYGKTFQVVRNVPELHLNNNSDNKRDGFGLPIRLVYVGALNPGRGLELLIPLIRHMPQFELVIIGDGPERKKLECISHDRVQFLGMKSPKELPELLSQADIGINLLSDASPSYYYSLANKFFDYLHAGLPVLCMDYPEYSSIQEEYDCCYMVGDYKKEDIRKVLEILCTEGMNHDKPKFARQAAKEYNWEIEHLKLLKLFKMSRS